MKVLFENRILSNVLFELDDGRKIWYTELNEDQKKEANEILNSALIPAGLVKTLQIMEDDWMVTRVFMRKGKPVYVTGFGATRDGAIKAFETELEMEKSDDNTESRYS